jgi:hypothetical protein
VPEMQPEAPVGAPVESCGRVYFSLKKATSDEPSCVVMVTR